MAAIPISRGKQPGQAGEIVGGHIECELEADAGNAAQHRFGGGADSFSPAKRLLDPLAFALADGIARMPHGAAVDGRAFAAT